MGTTFSTEKSFMSIPSSTEKTPTSISSSIPPPIDIIKIMNSPNFNEKICIDNECITKNDIMNIKKYNTIISKIIYDEKICIDNECITKNDIMNIKNCNVLTSKIIYDEKNDALNILSNIVDSNNFYSKNNVVRGNLHVYEDLYTTNDIIKM